MLIEAAWCEVQPVLPVAGPLHLQLARYSTGLVPREHARLSSSYFGLTLIGVAPPPHGTPEALWWGTSPDAQATAENASVVVTHAAGRDPQVVLGDLMIHHPGCLLAGVVIQPGHCLTGVRRNPLAERDIVFADVMTVTGPAREASEGHLYPMAIYGWMQWLAHEQKRAGGTPRLITLPPPPHDLVLVDAFLQEPCPLTVTDARQVQWPWPPPKRPMSWIEDSDLP
ncbi:hypothetical protein LN042_19015 [Kitasatospora sp. RB6PN24]|uniref:hypothetical protein n=1 Tax=Kitasatospora humi TaxID=2893891 RepID=UPI001E286552|nr:hypothetical protein [Kitasatospora humi]MCC9309148.1 hypothetical protein [Kitasatospora humi]